MKKNINNYDIEQKTKKISQSNLTLKQKEKYSHNKYHADRNNTSFV